jgi:hypothetical protein
MTTRASRRHACDFTIVSASMSDDSLSFTVPLRDLANRGAHECRCRRSLRCSTIRATPPRRPIKVRLDGSQHDRAAEPQDDGPNRDDSDSRNARVLVKLSEVARRYARRTQDAFCRCDAKLTQSRRVAYCWHLISADAHRARRRSVCHPPLPRRGCGAGTSFRRLGCGFGRANCCVTCCGCCRLVVVLAPQPALTYRASI